MTSIQPAPVYRVPREQSRGTRQHPRAYEPLLLLAAAVICLMSGAALTATPALAVPAHVLSSSFGSAGSGAGQLQLAASSEVAVSQGTGDLYVADTGNRRVDQFTASGAFVRAFGLNVGGSGVDVCTTSCATGASSSVPGAFEEPVLVAVDNSKGPSEGDVYVGDLGDSLISKFTAAGVLEKTWGSTKDGQLGGFTAHGGGQLAGIAVATDGSLFAVETNELTFWFNQDGTEHSARFFTLDVSPPGLAIDTEGNLYEFRKGTLQKFSDSGVQLGFELAGDERGVGLAVDTSNNDIYITQHAKAGEGGDVQRFVPGCEKSECAPLEEFGFEPGELKAPQGLAVNQTTHTVYVADSAANEIDVFVEHEVPPPTVGAPIVSEVSYTTAKVSGSVDPNGHSTTCRFEYVTDAQFKESAFADAQSTSPQSAPCAANPGAGSSPVSVEAELTGLHASTTYHVRLTGENRGISGNTMHSPEPNVSFETLVVGPPTITIQAPTSILPTSAHFAGQINPNAPAGDPPAFDVEWGFKCTPACLDVTGGTIVADSTTHAVSTGVTGLEPGREYKVTLVGTNAGGSTSALNGPLSFTTPAVAPGVISSSVTAASGTEATLSSQIDPGGAPTNYHFEYITEAQYLADGESFGEGMVNTPQAGPLGSAGDNNEHEAGATITGLSANTNYRFRVVAQNNVETVDGPSELLYSYSPQVFGPCVANEQLREENNSLLLPDCRAYEQVSPADNAEAFIPFGQNVQNEGLDDTQLPMQSAAAGGALVYVAEPAGSGACEGTGNAGGGEGDEYLAVRGEAGWSSCDIQPLASDGGTAYEGFSEDLSQGVLRTQLDESLASGVAGHCGLLYSRGSESGAFTALFAPEAGEVCIGSDFPFYVGASSDRSQVAFEAKAALAPGAVKSNEALGHENVYDSAGGQAHLVNVLPGASPPAASDASVGALSSEPNFLTGPGGLFPALNASNAVSSDGSEIFWTDLAAGSGVIYARQNAADPAGENGACEAERACTLQVSAGAATYQAATPDGHYAYYTEAGELWRYDTQAQTREALAGAGAGVQGVIGVNQSGQDGAYLYFVAEGNLAAGAEARKCKAAPAGPLQTEEEEGKAPAGYGCNLYLIHEDATSLAAVLLASDDEFAGNEYGTAQPQKGDWRPVLGYRSAELTPDGRSIVFMSNRQLTSYQNVNTHGECSPGNNLTHSCVEIYLYNAEVQSIACASCAPSGAPPIKAEDAHNEAGKATYLPGDFGSLTQMRRLISADGSRVFFNSDQPLLPLDKDGIQDVYEWERPAQPGEIDNTCKAEDVSSATGGCTYLLSGGASGSSGSYLLDADETGDNAFFVSRTAFVPGGGNGEKPNVFDARVDGGFKGAPGAIIQPPECKTAEECKEPQGEPPVESFPASAAFSGAGNLIAPLEAIKPPAEKPASRKLTRAQQLAKALKACRKDRSKKQRTKCETSAHGKYSPTPKKKTKSAKKSSHNGRTN
jgi:hypothetical protein